MYDNTLMVAVIGCLGQRSLDPSLRNCYTLSVSQWPGLPVPAQQTQFCSGPPQRDHSGLPIHLSTSFLAVST